MDSSPCQKVFHFDLFHKKVNKLLQLTFYLKFQKKKNLQEKKEKLQKQMNILPKGYPQKYMYKFPKLDAIGCQAGITPFHSQVPT